MNQEKGTQTLDGVRANIRLRAKIVVQDNYQLLFMSVEAVNDNMISVHDVHQVYDR